jgi:hypothetical protein
MRIERRINRIILLTTVVLLAAIILTPASLSSGFYREINELPLHPLVVHSTVVLLPIASLFILIKMWSRISIPRPFILTLLAIGLLSAVLSNKSGEALSILVGYPSEHAAAGERVGIVAALTFILFVVFGRFKNLFTKIITSLSALALVFATYQAGHTGAESVWKFQLESAKEPISLSNEQKFERSAISSKNLKSECWTIIDEKVYDLTQFFFRYPGETEDLLQLCGIDGSETYSQQLEGNKFPRSALTRYQVGRI